MVLLDVHGWLNQTIGSSLVGKYYCEQFSLTNSPVDNAKGYLTRWGQSRGMHASLIELPYPASSDDIISRDFAGKFVTATSNLLNNIIPEVGIPVTGISINKSVENLQTNSNVQLEATIYPTNATNKKVLWSSSDTSIATVDSNGLVTSLSTSGSAIITATSEDGGYTDTCTITVTSAPIALTSISVQPSTITFNNLGSKQLTITYVPSNASNKEVTWTSNNTKVATVSENGLVTAGNTNGTATITVTSVDGGYMATVVVYVDCSSIQNQIRIMTDEILARAAAVTDFEWRPIEEVYKWNSDEKFLTTETYTGVPYTLATQYTTAGFQSKYDQRDANGQCYLHTIKMIYKEKDRMGPSIGSCCASLVSEAWGLVSSSGNTPLIASVTKLLGDSRIDIITEEINFDLDCLKPGDALTMEGHCLLVGYRNSDGTYQIFEETPPKAKYYDASISIVKYDGKQWFRVTGHGDYDNAIRLQALNDLYHSL